MNKEEFEAILEKATEKLQKEARSKNGFKTAKDFENRVKDVLVELLDGKNIEIDFIPSPQIFPDIAVGEFGVEVKFTTNDTWRSVANSVFESTRNPAVIHIYIIFGKMGGNPGVRWGKYEDCVMHVRTSHVWYPQRLSALVNGYRKASHDEASALCKFLRLPKNILFPNANIGQNLKKTVASRKRSN